VIVGASSTGVLCRLRMEVPTAPGSDPSAISLQGGSDFDESRLNEWLTPHRGAVRGLDVSPDSSEVRQPPLR
jgi:hypothetical protein